MSLAVPVETYRHIYARDTPSVTALAETAVMVDVMVDAELT